MDTTQPNGRRATAKRWAIRKARRAAWGIAVALPLALGVRAAVAETFRATTDAVAPEVPRDARVLVYKLARSYHGGDIVAYHTDAGGAVRLGRVVSADAHGVTVHRSAEGDAVVPADRLVGRVVLSTR